jgi:16S rRNA (cytidine1402-2'-O)-methyltransferase
VPIGHVDDTTIRVQGCLNSVPAIACEDTRVTQQLLRALKVGHGPELFRMDQYQEKRSFHMFDRYITEGDVAYVSDAGSPGLSDPGALLVDYCYSNGISVQVLPGVSSLSAFISMSGCLINDFMFGGFLPKTERALTLAVDKVVANNQCSIWFESPKRIEATLAIVAAVYPQLSVVVAKEITKPYERVLRGAAEDVCDQLKDTDCRGEWVVMLDAREWTHSNEQQCKDVAQVCLDAGLTGKQVKMMAPLVDLPKNELYHQFQQL